MHETFFSWYRLVIEFPIQKTSKAGGTTITTADALETQS